jgi:hypothetical protein
MPRILVAISTSVSPGRTVREGLPRRRNYVVKTVARGSVRRIRTQTELRRQARILVSCDHTSHSFRTIECDSVGPVVLGCPDGRGASDFMLINRMLHRLILVIVLANAGLYTGAISFRLQGHEDEIVANLAGGRVIVHVAKDLIIFAAIDQPVERNSIPPRVMDLDATHIGILFGASEWKYPSDPKPIRLDRNFQRVSARDPRYQTAPGEAEPDLETLGEAFLEKLRPLVAQLHHKLDFAPEEPIFQVVIIGYAPNDYGPEVWVLEYRIEQEQIAARDEYWQTRILRPRFTQIYPPEKHAPRTIVEIRYPADAKGPTLPQLIEGNDPEIDHLGSSDPRLAKVLESIRRGQAQKTAPVDSVDFMRAVLPLINEGAHFVLGTMEERRGFEWVVPPDEPVEKAEEKDKNRPPEAPTLRKKPIP